MYLKRIVLHKFKRFFLSGVDHFEYTPDSNITVIAWGNGQGKSSLLSQLNPLPADLKKDYREDGYKYLEFTHNGKEYITSSGYVAKGKHSFIVDHIELNTSGTGAVQKQLVEEHLKLTPNIFNILLGIDNLTTMSPSIRKHWFTLLSPIDYTFSIGVWNKLRSRARDILGSIKINQDELIKKTSSILNKEDLDKLKQLTSIIDNYILELSKELVKVEKPESRFSNTDLVNSLFNKLGNLTLAKERLSNIEEILNIQEAYLKLGNYESRIKSIDVELNKYAKVLKELETLKENITLKDLENRISSTEEHIKNIKNTLPEFTLGLGKIYHLELLEVSNKAITLLDILNTPEYKEIGSRKDLNTITEELEKIKNIRIKLMSNIETLKSSIKELESNNSLLNISCPNCNHSWNHSPYGEQIEKYKKSLIDFENKLKVVIEQQESLNKKESILKDKISKLDNLIEVLSNNTLKEIFKGNTFTPDNIITILNKSRVIVDSILEVETLTKTLEELKKQKEIKQHTESIGINNIDTIEKDIVKLQEEKNTLISKITNIKQLINTFTNIQELLKSVKEYQEFRYKEYNYLIDSKRNELYSRDISLLKLELNEATKKIQDNETNIGILNNLQKSIDSNKIRYKVLSAMVDELSPDTGLIAKSINSFLNNYLTEMNNFINSVWSYNMELLPCEVEDGNDLNYKFKVKVNHDEVIEDVSKLSSSMQEIVNLAFKIIFIKYLGLVNYPLILDEFGRTMDAEHRVAAYDVIDRILANNFDQIVLVCHFESMYSRFVNADFLELRESPDNLTIRKDENE